MCANSEQMATPVAAIWSATIDLLSDGRTIGHLSRKFQLRDRYVLDVGGDVDLRLDRRLAIALAVGLDTLQNR